MKNSDVWSVVEIWHGLRFMLGATLKKELDHVISRVC